MVLKKQTVWLLTMLSLIVVLSVYYITTPGQTNDMAGKKDEEKQEQKETATDPKNKEEDLTSSIQESAALVNYRSEKIEDRNDLAQKYNNVIATATEPAEVTEAKAKLDSLNELRKYEQLLANSIMASGFSDVVVKSNAGGHTVSVYVDAKKGLSLTEANQIVNMAHEYLGSHKIVKVVRK